MQDLKSLKEAAQAAQPIETDLYGDRHFQGPYSQVDLTKEQDAFLHAASPDVILSLIAELEQLRAEKAAAQDVNNTTPLPNEFWCMVANCGGTKDLGKNARLLQEWVKSYACSAAAAASAKPVEPAPVLQAAIACGRHAALSAGVRPAISSILP